MAEWINVKDRLPDRFKVVLIAVDGCQVSSGFRMYENDEAKPWFYNGSIEDNVTHWTEMPEPPTS